MDQLTCRAHHTGCGHRRGRLSFHPSPPEVWGCRKRRDWPPWCRGCWGAWPGGQASSSACCPHRWQLQSPLKGGGEEDWALGKVFNYNIQKAEGTKTCLVLNIFTWKWHVHVGMKHLNQLCCLWPWSCTHVQDLDRKPSCCLFCSHFKATRKFFQNKKMQ